MKSALTTRTFSDAGHKQYLAHCDCGNRTTKVYARTHGGRCKQCAGGDLADASERELRIMETYGSYAAYQREEDHQGPSGD